MSMENENVQNRLDQAMSGGTPQINPDEQRRYLGTFKERVFLAIPTSEVLNPNAIASAQKIIDNHPHLTIIINGNLTSSQQSPYIKIATKSGAKFTLNTNSIYGTNPNDYAIVIASDHAVNQKKIDFNKLDFVSPAKPAPQKTFWQKLFNK